MQIFIKTLTGSVIPMEANGVEKIEQVKHLIHCSDVTYKPDEFNLSFSGSLMDESRTLVDYNVRHESTIYIGTLGLKRAAITCLEINGEVDVDAVDDDSESDAERFCDNCDSAKVVAPYYCKNCDAGLCESCKEIHSALKISRKHVIVASSEHVTCSKHPEKSIEFKCSCGEMICVTCATALHNGHMKCTLQEAAALHRVDLVERSAGLLEDMMAVLSEMTRVLVEKAGHVNCAHEAIDAIGSKFIEAVNRQIREAHEQVDAKAAPQIQELQVQSKTAQRLVACAKSCAIVAQRLVEEGSDIDVCGLTQYLDLTFESVRQRSERLSASAQASASVSASAATADTMESASAAGGAINVTDSGDIFLSASAIPSLATETIVGFSPVGGSIISGGWNDGSDFISDEPGEKRLVIDPTAPRCGCCQAAIQPTPRYEYEEDWMCNWPAHQGTNGFPPLAPQYGCASYCDSCFFVICSVCWDDKSRPAAARLSVRLSESATRMVDLLAQHQLFVVQGPVHQTPPMSALHRTQKLVELQWSSMPCAYNRVLLLQHLRKIKTVAGEKWTTHHIAHEFEDFAIDSESIDLSSQSFEIGKAFQGSIQVKRTVDEETGDGNNIDCIVHLSGFRGTAEITVTAFRFGKGAPRRKTANFTLITDRGCIFPSLFTLAELISQGWLTADNHQIRLLVTLHLREDEALMASLHWTIAAHPAVTSCWSAPPCQYSRVCLAEQLQQQVPEEGQRWTSHHIAHEFQSADFADDSKLFNLSSPRVDLFEGVQGCIKICRKKVNKAYGYYSTFGCYACLSGFRGLAKFSITAFRFERGLPKQMSDSYTRTVDTEFGRSCFFSLAELVNEGWLTEDHKIRFLLTLHLKVNEELMAGLQRTIAAHPEVTLRWSATPCKYSRVCLAEQLQQKQQQVAADGQRWTTHHIAHEFQSANFAHGSKPFNLSSPRVDLFEGARGCINIRREEADGTVGCYACLSGFRGLAKFTIAAFRFERGSSTQKSGSSTWIEGMLMGWPKFLTQAELATEGWLTPDHKIRLLLTLHLKRG